MSNENHYKKRLYFFIRSRYAMECQIGIIIKVMANCIDNHQFEDELQVTANQMKPFDELILHVIR